MSLADATDPGAWEAPHEVLCNLPFGARSRRRDVDLKGLYAAILGRLSRSLRPGGRAVLYTANARTLQPLLESRRSALRVVASHRTASGGLAPGIWVLEPESAHRA